MLGERTRVLQKWFYITGVEPGALSGSKKVKHITVLIQKEPVTWIFVCLNQTKRTSCLVLNSLSIAVAAILPLRVR